MRAFIRQCGRIGLVCFIALSVLAFVSYAGWVESAETNTQTIPIVNEPAPVPPASSAIESPQSSAESPESTAPAPAKPMVTLKMPTAADVGHQVHCELEKSGGAIREQHIFFEPPLADGEWSYDLKTVKLADGTELEVKDDSRFHFTAPAGITSVRVLCIGKDISYAEPTARIEVMPDVQPQPIVDKEVPPTAKQIVDGWLSAVTSRNKVAESLIVAKAAYDTAREIRGKVISGDRAVARWAATSALRMGQYFTAWNVNLSGPSFFKLAEDEFAVSQQLKDSDPANFLENVASALEAK